MIIIASVSSAVLFDVYWIPTYLIVLFFKLHMIGMWNVSKEVMISFSSVWNGQVWKVLTVVYDTQDWWVCAPCPSFGMPNRPHQFASLAVSVKT
jgi:hypothetical protein